MTEGEPSAHSYIPAGRRWKSSMVATQGEQRSEERELEQGENESDPPSHRLKAMGTRGYDAYRI